MDKKEFMALCRKSLKEVKSKSAELTEDDYDKTFKDLGFDSLDVMMFLLAMDTALDREVAELDIQEYNTPNKIYEFYMGAGN